MLHSFSFRKQTCCKVLFSLTALTFAAFAFVGCNPSEKKQDSSTATQSPSSDFKVALVASGPTSDNGWNAGGLKGLETVKAELGLKDDQVVSVDNQKSASEQEKSLTAFASKKFNVVFAHGNEYEEIALKIEKDFPKTLFVISSGRKIGSNTTPIVLQLEDGAYLEGMLAGGMSKTGKVAMVGAMDIAPVKSVFTAFEKGAKAVNPNIQVLKAVYTGSWDDPNKAKSATLPLIDQGADFIMQDVDAAAQGGFGAVQEKNKSGKQVYALGTNSDQNAAAPDVVIASAPIYNEKVWVMIAKGVKDGTFKPTDKPFDMKSGAIGFVLNPELASKIPADLKQKIEEAKKKITSGTMNVTN